MQIQDERPPAPTDREVNLLHLLQRIWTYAITTKSDDARAYADEIAEGSSRGFITTLVVYGAITPVYGRLWKLTPEGGCFLKDNAHKIANEEIAAYVEDHSAD